MVTQPEFRIPENTKELFARLTEIAQHGEYEMPKKRYSGTGGPGLFLEDLLGLRTGNRDVPDTLGWELKFYTPTTNLITLFHKEPQPEGVIRNMVTAFGWKDAQNRLSFRHTLSSKSPKFQLKRASGQVRVIPSSGEKRPIPFWTEDEILSSAGAKLRRLILVRGVKKGQKVTFDRIDTYENIQLSYFIDEILLGTVKIDFDVREMKPGSVGLRNHGTKFRVQPNDVCALYAKKIRLG